MGESKLYNTLRLEAVKYGCILLRNNSGCLQDKRGQYVRYGVANPGGADLIGWTQRHGVAVFTAVEVKTAKGKLTATQAAFLAAVQTSGGIAGVVRSVDDLRALLGRMR